MARTWRWPPDRAPTSCSPLFTRVMPKPANLFERDLLCLFQVQLLEEAAPSRRLGAEEEIARDAHQRNSANVLTTVADPARAGVARVGKRHYLAVHQDLAQLG